MKKLDKKNRISIIVPVYNRENTISRCLDSLCNQTYKNIEIICVDDGSTDNSLNILKEYQKKDTRIKIIENKQNMGIAYSRNIALKSSNTEFIMWCDSDDWYDKNMCKKMIKGIIKKDVDLVESGAKFIFGDDLGIRKFLNNRNDFIVDSIGKYKIDINTLSKIRGFLWNKIFKKSIIDKYNLTFADIKTHEDLVFVYLYAMLSKSVLFLKDKLYNYYIHTGSTIDNVYEEMEGMVEFKEVEYLGIYLASELHKRNLVELYPIYNELYYRIILRTLKNYEKLKTTINNYMTIKLKSIYSNSKFTSCAMNICLSSNDNYIEHLATTMTSVLMTARPTDYFNFFILDGGISKKNKKKILELKNIRGCYIEFIAIDVNKFKTFPIRIEYMSLETYFRYLIPILKPELERILYLDCDTIVLRSLNDLYNMNFENNYLIAVKDSWFIEQNPFYKKYYIGKPFNAGVLLINNKKWWKDNISAKLFEATNLLKNDLQHEDQDVLNYLFKDKVKFVDISYNLQTFSLATEKFEGNSTREIQHYIFEPVIVHYTGKDKPWTTSECMHPYASQYFKFKAFSPFKKNIKKDLKRIYNLK